MECREQGSGHGPVVHEVGCDRGDAGERRERPARAPGAGRGKDTFELGQGVLGARGKAADGNLAE